MLYQGCSETRSTLLGNVTKTGLKFMSIVHTKSYTSYKHFLRKYSFQSNEALLVPFMTWILMPDVTSVSCIISGHKRYSRKNCSTLGCVIREYNKQVLMQPPGLEKLTLCISSATDMQGRFFDSCFCNLANSGPISGGCASGLWVDFYSTWFAKSCLHEYCQGIQVTLL